MLFIEAIIVCSISWPRMFCFWVSLVYLFMNLFQKFVQLKMVFSNGPDQLVPADDFVTLTAEGSVKLRIGDSVPSNYDPISVPGLFMKTVKASPNHPALAVKRNGEWIKWNYSQYYTGKFKKAKS